MKTTQLHILLLVVFLANGCGACNGKQLNHATEPDGSPTSGSVGFCFSRSAIHMTGWRV